MNAIHVGNQLRGKLKRVMKVEFDNRKINFEVIQYIIMSESGI